jgi:hypothetical protein
MANIANVTTELKDNGEAIKELKSRRKDIKGALTKDGLCEKDEAPLAKELQSVCTAITALEGQRAVLCDQLQTFTQKP